MPKLPSYISYKDVKDEVITDKLWSLLFIVLSSYDNTEKIKAFIKDKPFSRTGNIVSIGIKDYFLFAKNEKILPRMSLLTFQKVWYLIAEIKDKETQPYAIVASIGGSPVFGSDRGANRFNTIKINLKKPNKPSKMKISSKLTPFHDRGGFISLDEIKNMLEV